MPKPRRLPTPNQQGALDSLCGVYAIVNALRVLADARGARPAPQTLFTAAVEQADREISLVEALTVGIEPDLLWRILKATTTALQGRPGLSVAIDRPFLRRKGLTITELHHRIERDIGETGAAFIVGLTGCLDHWSVVHRVTPATFRLFDSIGAARLDLARCAVANASSPAPPGLHLFMPSSIFRLAPRLDDRPPSAEPSHRRVSGPRTGNR